MLLVCSWYALGMVLPARRYVEVWHALGMVLLSSNTLEELLP
jgi:hypothetical protein